jgi:hypothetical protein
VALGRSSIPLNTKRNETVQDGTKSFPFLSEIEVRLTVLLDETNSKRLLLDSPETIPLQIDSSLKQTTGKLIPTAAKWNWSRKDADSIHIGTTTRKTVTFAFGSDLLADPYLSMNGSKIWCSRWMTMIFFSFSSQSSSSALPVPSFWANGEWNHSLNCRLLSNTSGSNRFNRAHSSFRSF